MHVQSPPTPPGIHTAGGEQTGHYPGSPCIKQLDIRQFLKDGDPKDGNSLRGVTFVNKPIEEEPIDKMRMIRNKMVEARRAAERARNMVSMDKKTTRSLEELSNIVYARDVDNSLVQDPHHVVVVGRTSKLSTRTLMI